MIVVGAMDELPENAFFNVGTIDEAIAKAESMEKESGEMYYGKHISAGDSGI